MFHDSPRKNYLHLQSEFHIPYCIRGRIFLLVGIFSTILLMGCKEAQEVARMLPYENVRRPNFQKIEKIHVVLKKSINKSIRGDVKRLKNLEKWLKNDLLEYDIEVRTRLASKLTQAVADSINRDLEAFEPTVMMTIEEYHNKPGKVRGIIPVPIPILGLVVLKDYSEQYVSVTIRDFPSNSVIWRGHIAFDLPRNRVSMQNVSKLLIQQLEEYGYLQKIPK